MTMNSKENKMAYETGLGNRNSCAVILDPFYLSKLMDEEFKKTGEIQLHHLKGIGSYLNSVRDSLDIQIKGLRDSDIYHEQAHYQKIADDLKHEIDLLTEEGRSDDSNLNNKWWSAHLVAENAKDRNVGEPLNQERYQDLASVEIHGFLKFVENGPGLRLIQPNALELFAEIANGLRFSGGLEAVNEFISRLTTLSLEVSRFESAFVKIYNQIDLIRNAFSSQKITYINGEIDYAKIYRILKKNFGYDYPHSLIWWGAVVYTAMNTTQTLETYQPSTLQVGLGFENHVEKLYRGFGYSVSTTPSSGDFGVDLIAISNTEKIAIQCKRYATPVGPEAVMQVYSGAAYYECTRFAVFSINGFTNAATEMAKKLRVELFNINASDIA